MSAAGHSSSRVSGLLLRHSRIQPQALKIDRNDHRTAVCSADNSLVRPAGNPSDSLRLRAHRPRTVLESAARGQPDQSTCALTPGAPPRYLHEIDGRPGKCDGLANPKNHVNKQLEERSPRATRRHRTSRLLALRPAHSARTALASRPPRRPPRLPRPRPRNLQPPRRSEQDECDARTGAADLVAGLVRPIPPNVILSGNRDADEAHVS